MPGIYSMKLENMCLFSFTSFLSSSIRMSSFFSFHFQFCGYNKFNRLTLIYKMQLKLFNDTFDKSTFKKKVQKRKDKQHCKSSLVYSQ